MTTKIIAFDIDSVLAEIMEPWLSRYNKDYDDTLTQEKITNWEIHSFCKPKCSHRIYDYLTPDLYDETKPIPGALQAVHNARRLGRVIFVTSAAYTPGRKFAWLKDNGFFPKEHDYVECRDKSLIKADVMIDDYETNLASFPRGILFDQPWNQHSKLFRICNFDGFEGVLKERLGML
jgi:5'-nucleotidase